ncbi:MAG: flagellar basal body P-ring protein FlgI [Phycisphaeraceae bacterium JB051]
MPEAAPPPLPFTGPRFLHGTVGSMAKLRGYEPQLVSGWGLVVDLQATGSSDVPEYLRRKLINEMSRRGMGNPRLNAKQWSPRRVLSSRNTAVVAVYGLIPPGAVVGSTFDVWVTALPQTQTTSLVGGRLFTADLAIDGTNPNLSFSKPYANAFGDTYVSPVVDDVRKESLKYSHQRTAVILSGGSVTTERKLQLVLNQPSWARSRRIAERINQVFERGVSDRNQTASAQTDMLVDIHVPKRFAGNVEKFLELIQHLYVQGGVDFEPVQAAELGDVLKNFPHQAEHVMLAWEALGRTALPPIRRFYADQDILVRLTALEAGTYLEDGLAVEPLIMLAASLDENVRARAGRLLVEHPRSAAATNHIRHLLNDASDKVAITVYEALADKRDPLFIQRKLMGHGTEFKFILDIVEAQRPRVFIGQGKTPRIVIFNSYAGFKTPVFASLWDSRLLIKAMEPNDPMEVYYRPWSSDDEPVKQAKTYTIAPTVANLIFLMAHKQSLQNPTDGLNLGYSSVVEAIYTLSKQDKLMNKLIFQENPLAVQVAEARKVEFTPTRPETAPGGKIDPNMDLPGVGPQDNRLPAAPTRSEFGSDRSDRSLERENSNEDSGQSGMGAVPLP